MKVKNLVITAPLLWATLAAHAGVNINSREALDICKSSIRERTDGTVYHKFNRDHAVSTRGGDYTFWINSTLKNEERRYLLRTKCIASKQGELLTVEIEEGRW